MTKCPKCDQTMSQVKVEPIKGSTTGGTKWNCISFNCPHCHSSLGMQMDPIAIMTDTVNKIKGR